MQQKAKTMNEAEFRQSLNDLETAILNSNRCQKDKDLITYLVRTEFEIMSRFKHFKNVDFNEHYSKFLKVQSLFRTIHKIPQTA